METCGSEAVLQRLRAALVEAGGLAWLDDTRGMPHYPKEVQELTRVLVQHFDTVFLFLWS